MGSQVFGTATVSLRLYPHNEIAAPAIVDELCAQAKLAAESGFDGVMTSEHHGGFSGYLPNPLQAAGWCLETMVDGAWAAPCPILLPLRPPALVAEEVAWLAARFPGRVGLGVAAGALPSDFEIMGRSMDGLAAHFTADFTALIGILHGSDQGHLSGDPAIRACTVDPIPILSAAMGFTAARRAARLGAGVLFDSLSTPDRCRELSDAYRRAGGSNPCVLVRRVWLGDAPRCSFDGQVEVYRRYSSASAQSRWGEDEFLVDTDGLALAEQLVEVAVQAGADALNLRIHAEGIAPAVVRDQIERLGAEVVDPTRSGLVTATPGS